MRTELAFRARVGVGRSPRNVIVGLTARKAVRSGVIWGYIFGVSIASSAITYTRFYKTVAQRNALAATFGSDKCALRARSSAPNSGWIHRL
jgi:hypothetical protein